MKILVIEDHPTDQKLAHQVLSEAGFSVSSVKDWNHARSFIEGDRPELILLDMSLPGMDGMTILRMLKTDPETSDIKVVTVTCYPERYPKKKAMEAGCDGYLLKPISTRALPHQLNEFVSQNGGREAD